MGTLVLIVFGCGVNANMALKKTCGNGGGWICTTTGWAFAVLLGVYTSVALGAPQGVFHDAFFALVRFADGVVITAPGFRGQFARAFVGDEDVFKSHRSILQSFAAFFHSISSFSLSSRPIRSKRSSSSDGSHMG